MDLNQAVLVHQQWKSRLNQFLGGTSQEPLDPVTVGKDSACELGQWIHGEGRRQYQGTPEFQELLQCHARFHRKAGEVVRMAKQGDVKGAQAVFDQEFLDDSRSIALAIQHLKRLKAAPVR